MSMLPVLKTIVCEEGKTKQKVGVEYDINKIVAKYKKTGQMPSLKFNGFNLTEGDNGQVIDLTTVGDYQECQNRIAKAQEMFDRYPAMIRRRFDNNIENFVGFMTNIKNTENLEEAIRLGLVDEIKKPVTDTPKTTVNKDDKKE